MLRFNKILLASALLIFLSIFTSLVAATYEPFPIEAFGYIPIGSKGSRMFYQLQGGPSKTQAERAKLPLVCFLSGGPGGAFSFPSMVERIGNTALEVDPTNSSNYIITPSKYPWTSFANMLFPDSPLGTGFSNAADITEFSTTDESIANNLVTMLKGFLQNQPEFKNHDFWVVGESYSGKIAAFLGVAIMQSGLELNFKGISNNDGWTYPIGCMKSYGNFMRAHSLINKAQADVLDNIANQAEMAVATANGTGATNLWSIQQELYDTWGNNVNVYDIHYFYDYTAERFMNDYINGPFRAKLPPGLVPASKIFNDQDNMVFTQMSNAFMTDGIQQTQTLINAGKSVNVVSGQMDLIVDTLCTRSWIDILPWSKLNNYMNAPRKPFVLQPNAFAYYTNGFMQEYDNFRFWNGVQMGHMGNIENGATMNYMMEYVVNDGPSSMQKPFEDAARLGKERAALKKKYRRRGI